MQVAVYNYQKLQQIRAKASLSTGKDVEKMGGGQEQQPLLNGHHESQVKLTADSGPNNGFTFAAYRCTALSRKAWCCCACNSRQQGKQRFAGQMVQVCRLSLRHREGELGASRW